jgi:hypothetical protein
MAEDAVCLVLKDTWSTGDFKALAWDSGWNAVEISKEEPTGAVVDIWETDDARTWIHLVTDQLLGRQFVHISGEGRVRVVAEITAAGADRGGRLRWDGALA